LFFSLLVVEHEVPMTAKLIAIIVAASLICFIAPVFAKTFQGSSTKNYLRSE
jgi:hypothetical protein